MSARLILASGSEIRQTLLRNAGLSFDVLPIRVDETSIRAAMIGDGAAPRDIADHLAEQKARRAAAKSPGAIVIGSDQVLDLDGAVLGKAESPAALRGQLDRMNGEKHKLHSAAVIHENGRPVWRHVGSVTMHMRQATPAYLDDYVARNWDDVRHCVGGYKLEAEGIRLFDRVEGAYFNVLGLPLLELLAYLTLRGLIPG